jgi:hypothetical protein
MKKEDKAVSETIGTLLLLGISITLFSVIYFSVMTIYPISASPSVNIICSVEDTDIFIEHRGGKTLDLDTKFIVTIDGSGEKFTVNDYLSSESKANGVWNIGEKVVYPVGDITNKKVSLSVIDEHSNSVIVMVNIKE